MVIKTFAGSREEPAEYEYTDPVECHVCGEEFDADAHWHMIFELLGVPPNYVGRICGDCDILCSQCEWTVLETLPGRVKSVLNGVVWIDDQPYHVDCVAVALCQEAA